MEQSLSPDEACRKDMPRRFFELRLGGGLVALSSSRGDG
jgi:lipid-A-disaccharide synthase-like uncharacterized protein